MSAKFIYCDDENVERLELNSTDCYGKSIIAVFMMEVFWAFISVSQNPLAKVEGIVELVFYK